MGPSERLYKVSNLNTERSRLWLDNLVSGLLHRRLRYRTLIPSTGIVYSLVFMVPAATFLNRSPNSCIVFLIFVFGVSVSHSNCTEL